MLRRFLCATCFAVVLAFGPDAATAQSLTPPGEGLYAPDAIEAPPAVERAIEGVVRIDANLRFRLTVYASADSAAAARQRIQSAPKRGKTFRPDGTVIWPVALDTAQVRATCANPVASGSPAIFDVCRAWSDYTCRAYPCAITTPPLAGSSTGFAIGRRTNGDVLIGTAYHVAREAIERHERTGGVADPSPIAIDHLNVRVSRDGSHDADSYRPIDRVQLVANASEADWQAGKDWALLALPDEKAPPALRPLTLADTRPQPGDTLWAIGFPFRTRRDLAASSDYTNAAGDLRISVGRVVDPDTVAAEKHQPTDLVTTLDAVSGNSGSPVLNRDGEVVGLLRNTTLKQGDIDQRVARYGGLTLVAPIELMRPSIRKARSLP